MFYGNLDTKSLLLFFTKGLVRTERLREETSSGCDGWLRLGELMIQLGQFNKAEELYNTLLQQTTDDGTNPNLFHQLGWVKTDQRKYEEAVEFYEKDLEISQKTLSANHPDLAVSYNNIGLVYNKMGEYSKALSYYEKALEIRQRIFPANHPNLANSYNNIGGVYCCMRDNSKALSYFEQALDILQRSLSPNHPHITSVKECIEFVKKKL